MYVSAETTEEGGEFSGVGSVVSEEERKSRQDAGGGNCHGEILCYHLTSLDEDVSGSLWSVSGITGMTHLNLIFLGPVRVH